MRTDPHTNPVLAWKRYPYVAEWGDPHWFTFPACDGDGRALGVQTYFVDGFLRGRSTGRQYAFMTVFTDARVLDRTLRFSFYSLALFDCDRRHYGTYTDFDWPDPSAPGSPGKLTTAPDHLELHYAASAGAARGAMHGMHTGISCRLPHTSCCPVSTIMARRWPWSSRSTRDDPPRRWAGGSSEAR